MSNKSELEEGEEGEEESQDENFQQNDHEDGEIMEEGDGYIEDREEENWTTDEKALKKRKLEKGNETPISKQKKIIDTNESPQKEFISVLHQPYECPTSNVKLSFNTWISLSRQFRILPEEIQKMILGSFDEKATSCKFLHDGSSLVTNFSPDSRLYVVILDSCHPGFLSDMRDECSFFMKCSTMPCRLTRSLKERESELTTTELLFHIPRPPINFKNLSVEELFFHHEIKFQARHSMWTDVIMFHPSGKFFRCNQNDQGEWELDGDLLHLKWLRRDVDVLASEDGACQKFSTNSILDATYSTTYKTKPSRNRSLCLILQEAVPVDKEDRLSVNSEVKNNEEQAEKHDLSYYCLSEEELENNGFPIDIDKEQHTLLLSTDGNSRDRFVCTKKRNSNQEIGENEKLLGLDCEMCETDLGMEVTRITLVDRSGKVIYDQVIKPRSKIINYHTQFSGITEEMVQNTRVYLEDAQMVLLSMIFKDTLLVGHSLSNDLRAIRMIHTNVADTAVLYPHPRGLPFKLSLKNLCEKYLKKEIQVAGEAGHDSAEDAIASLELLLKKIKNGSTYGLPEQRLRKSADTLLDEMFRIVPKVKATFYGIEVKELGKPWQRFTCGESSDIDALKTADDCTGKNVLYVKRFSSLGDLEGSLVHDIKQDATFKERVALSWIHLNELRERETDVFLFDRDVWEEQQRGWINKIDKFLNNLYHQISMGSSIMIIPQNDIVKFRKLKAQRTQSRWKDATEKWTEDKENATRAALSGVIDSTVYLISK